MNCATPNCTRQTRQGFKFCDDCTAVVLRTGQPPVIERVPVWLQRALERPNGLAKILDGGSVA